MTFGFAQPPGVSLPTSADSAARLSRMLEPSEWASAGIPLLRNPREVVTGLHDRHLPGLSTAIVAVLGPEERVTASASFVQHASAPDGWEFRNALLARLRLVVPHDLRLRVPVRTAVLLYCREGDPRWTEADGAWMWGLRDACTLHGLRCGAYITLTRSGWQVLGEGRGGRRPRSVVRTERARAAEQPPRGRVPEQPGPAGWPATAERSFPMGQPAGTGRPAPSLRTQSANRTARAGPSERKEASGRSGTQEPGHADSAGQSGAPGHAEAARRPGPTPSGSPERFSPAERPCATAPQPYPAESRPPAEPSRNDGRPTARHGGVPPAFRGSLTTRGHPA